MTNFIKPKVLKRRVWKTLNVISTLAIVVNTGMVGVLLQPSIAKAGQAAANLDQCRNGASASHQDCDSSTWVNGNAGASNSHYVEGESIAYRARLTDLPTATPITITFGYDIKHSDKHAIDYLTHFDRTDVNVDPISGTGVAGAPTTFAFPAPNAINSPVAGQPTTSFNALAAAERVMSIWNGTISNIAYATQGDLTASQAETQINVTFTATNPTVVLSWGGHIGSRLDWGYDAGVPRSAGGISGSPYHMRLIGWSLGNLGQQDRSLAAGAVTPPGNVIIEKQTIPDGSSQTFAFTSATAGLSGTIGDGQQILGSLQPGQYTATETPTNGWTLTSIICDDTNSTGNASTGVVTFNVESQETVKCVFTNTRNQGTIELKKAWVGTAGQTTLNIGTSAGAADVDSQLTGAAGAAPQTTGVNTVNTGTYYVSETGGLTDYSSTLACTDNGSPVTPGVSNAVTVATGHAVVCTFTNTKLVPNLHVKKYVRLVTADPNVASNWYNFDAASQILTVPPGATVEYKVITWNSGTFAGNATVVDATSNAAIYSPDYAGGTLFTNVSIPNQNGASMPAVTTAMGTGSYWKIVTYTKAVEATYPSNGTVSSINTVTLNGSLTSSAKIQVAYSCNFEVTKDGPAAVNYTANGAQITYTLNYDNTGTTACTGGGVIVKDTIPTGTTFASAPVNPAYTLNNGIIQWNLGTVAAGATGSLSFTVNVSNNRSVQCGSWTIDNQASFYSTQEGWDTTNTLTTTVYKSCLKVQKVVDGGTALPEQFGFHLNANDPYDYPAAGTDFVLYTNLVPGQYTATEADPSGLDYTQTNTTCNNVTVTAGATATCSITNSSDTGKIDGYKFNDLNGDGTWDQGEPVVAGVLVTLSNGWTDTTDAQGYFSFDNVLTGTYTATESLGAGWINTTPNPVLNIVVTKNSTTSISFGNFKLGRIWGYKLDTLGNKLAGWEICLNGTFACDTTDANGMYEFTGLTAGTYTVAETLQQGWWAISPLIAGYIVPVTSGTDEQYDFTNFQGIDLKVNKLMDADGDTQTSGDQTPKSGWTIELWKDGNLFDTQVTDVNGSYTWTNLGPADYTVKEIFDANVYQALTPTQFSFTAVSGQDKEYTFINFKTPKLTVIKHVINDNGGTASADDFTMTVGGNNVSDASFPGDENGTTVTLNAGAYSVDELAFPGYAKTLGANCSGIVQSGDEVTCTITNDDIQPKLTVTKVVINDNGGDAVVSDFDLFVDATQVISGVQNGFNTGSYVVSEATVTQPGYTGTITGDCDANGNVTLGLADVKTCTITNDDQASTITLVKNVINNNNGTAQPNDFQLTIGGTPTLSGVAMPVQANTPYALDETQVQGYSFVSLTGDAKCPRALGGTVTLDEGENVTCTITNDDIQPKLTVTKVVVNDNGGTKVVADFPLFVDQTSVTSGVQNGFNAGNYVVSETTDPGYAATITGDCDANGNVSLKVGDVKSCTITNNDIQPKLTVTKVVVNDNGGTAVVADFPLFVDATGVTSGVQNGFDADVYVVSETNLTGYEATISGDCDKNGNITLQPGDVKSCTITNDDVAPKLKLIKTVVNDNGGTKVVADFPLFVDQTSVTSGQWNTLTAGVQYTASETTDPGYQASNWGGDCAANGTITLNVGDQKVCTITNDDIQPKLVVTKHVVNDNLGTAVAGDFTLNVTGTNATPASFAGDENGTNVALDAGAYSVDENFFFGYAKTLGQNCSGTINVGETKYCTITNDDIPGRVTGNKFEDVNRNGVWDGTENGLANWTFYLRTGSETGPIAYTTTSDANGYFEFTSVNVGTYYLTEEVKAKWDQITPSNPGYFVVTVTPGYDTLAQCEQEFSLVRVNFNPQCGFTFGNAERVNLHLDKWNDQEVAHGGDGVLQTTETVNYHIDWSVSGNSIATNVVLKDIIPTQLNLNVASISNGGTWDAATRTITWNFGTQQPNASGFVTYSATVIVPIANGTEIVNVAKISADNSDPKFLEDNSKVKVASAPQLQITKTVNATIVNPGDPISYTVKVKNIGTDTAINAVMTDTLPAGFSFVSTNPTAASIVGQTGTWNLGNMTVGQEVTITYTVNVAPGTTAGTYDNIAKAKADNAPEVSTKVPVQTRVPQVLGEQTNPVLQLRKSVSKATVAPGDVITYTVEIKNTGTGSAINVILTDLLPVGFTFDGSTDTTKEWSLGDLAVGETKTVSYKVKVGSGVPNGSYENLAIVSADNHGKVTTSVPVQVKRGRVLAEVVDTGAGPVDLAVAGAGLGLIVLGYVLTRRKRGEELA